MKRTYHAKGQIDPYTGKCQLRVTGPPEKHENKTHLDFATGTFKEVNEERKLGIIALPRDSDVLLGLIKELNRLYKYVASLEELHHGT